MFASSRLKAQPESVHLHLDKTVCYPGDTLWMRGYILQDHTIPSVSTNLFVEVYDDSRLLSRQDFFIVEGVSLGQIITPGKPGLYWIRSYTPNTAPCLQSLTVRDNTEKVITRSLVEKKELPVTTTIAGLTITSFHTLTSVSAIVTTDSVCKYNGQRIQLSIRDYEEELGQYSFVLEKGTHKEIPLPTLGIRGYMTLVYAHADTVIAAQYVYIPSKPVPVELNTNTDDYILQIDDNRHWTWSLTAIRGKAPYKFSSILHAFAMPGNLPRLDSASRLCYEGLVEPRHRKKQKILSKSLVLLMEQDSSIQTRVLSIDPWGRVRVSGMKFFGTAFVHYSLYNSLSNSPKAEISLKMDFPPYSPFIPPKKEEYTVDTFHLAAAASDFAPHPDSIHYQTIKGGWADASNGFSPVNCRYTIRRCAPFDISDMNVIPLRGYDRPLEWSTPDRTTLLWVPYISSNSFSFHIPGNSRPFTIVLDGVSTTGETLHVEKIVE